MVTRTLEASVRSSAFWLAVIIPPAGYWILVQLFAYQSGETAISLTKFVLLIVLAHGLPLIALGWMLCSVAAYTITSGKLVEHRVVCDREFALGPHVHVAQLTNGDIAVRLSRRTLRLRVNEPACCLALLREAGEARHEG
jgi:hypothetical protein